jgi:hypothetical protein
MGRPSSKDKLVNINDVNLGVVILEDGESIGKTVPIDEGDFQVCPECGGSDIEYDINGIEPESVFVYRVHECNKCGTKWDERYDLTQVVIERSKNDSKE